MEMIIYTQDGKVKEKQKLAKEVFAVKHAPDLIHRMVVLQEANKRYPLAHTLTRGDVRGGGKKPFKQKGTGRARQGSNRSPIMKGGGIVFGPRSNRNFALSMPKKMRQKALCSALSSRVADDVYVGLEKYDQSYKTRDFVKLLSTLSTARNTLLVVDDNISEEHIMRSARNIDSLRIIRVAYLNVRDVLHFHKICFVGDSYKTLIARFTS
jgi:large subunit ribosomal protein L4